MVDVTRDGPTPSGPEVEENGIYWGVFLLVLIVLLISAVVALFHSLAATFG